MATKPPKHFCYLGSLFEIFRIWLAFDLWRLLNVWNYWPDPTRTYPTCLLKIIAKWPYVSLRQANLLIIASVFCRFSFDLRRNVTKLPDLRFSWTLWLEDRWAVSNSISASVWVKIADNGSQKNSGHRKKCLLDRIGAKVDASKINRNRKAKKAAKERERQR